MAAIENGEGRSFEASCDIAIVGAGAAGLVAALRASEAGAEVLVFERDRLPSGSTALSAGLIPASGTRFQQEAGLTDSNELFVADILSKAHGEPEREAVETVVSEIGPTLEWLADRHGLPFSVIANFTYPGHSANRMHGLPSRSGAELMDHLRAAAERAGVGIVAEARVSALFADASGRISGVRFLRPDGTVEEAGCGALILACNGYGGDRQRVSNHIPEMAEALYFGHPGNQGDALAWGEALGARTRHLSGYQGHGSVAHPQGILITWATMTEGGFQVNSAGDRFSNEATGYSEQAARVLAQPGAIAWSVFDSRIAGIAGQFEDFRNAQALGAVIRGETIEALADSLGLPSEKLAASLAEVAAAKDAGGRDRFGRDFSDVPQLEPPYCAVKVTGALFHTQGGLVVNHEGRVMRTDGAPFANLFAAGGAACGVSGSAPSGYLSGNGLLTAVAYGSITGREAARDRNPAT